MRKNKVIDLVLNKDGEYEPADTVKNRSKSDSVVISKQERVDPASAFLIGIDYGIDFLENFVGRVNRLNNIIK